MLHHGIPTQLCEASVPSCSVGLGSPQPRRPLFLQGGHAGLGRGLWTPPGTQTQAGPSALASENVPPHRESLHGNSAPDPLEGPGGQAGPWHLSPWHLTTWALLTIAISSGGQPGALLGMEGGHRKEWKLRTEPGPSLSDLPGWHGPAKPFPSATEETPIHPARAFLREPLALHPRGHCIL